MCMPNVLACLSKPEKTYWSLTPQLDVVIIEVLAINAPTTYIYVPSHPKESPIQSPYTIFVQKFHTHKNNNAPACLGALLLNTTTIETLEF